MTNIIAIANGKLNFSNWIKWIQGQIQYGQSNMISHDYAGMDFLKVSFHQVESPLALAQGTQHLLCPCMYMYLLHVDTCASPLREGYQTELPRIMTCLSG